MSNIPLEKYIQADFLRPNELVKKQTKTLILNSIETEIKELLNLTSDKSVTYKLNSLLAMSKEAFVIDMYTFQFASFEVVMRKELKNMRDYIGELNSNG